MREKFKFINGVDLSKQRLKPQKKLYHTTYYGMPVTVMVSGDSLKNMVRTIEFFDEGKSNFSLQSSYETLHVKKSSLEHPNILKYYGIAIIADQKVKQGVETVNNNIGQDYHYSKS